MRKNVSEMLPEAIIPLRAMLELASDQTRMDA
jgi:hypothetical protein